MNKILNLLFTALFMMTAGYAIMQERTDLAIFLLLFCVYIELISKGTK